MPAPSLSHLASPLRPAAAARLVASISRSLVTDPFPGVSSGSARALSVFPAHSTHRRSRSVVTVLGAHSASRPCPTRKVASSPPPPASRSTAATRRPANSHALTRSPSQASLQQKASSSRAAVTPTSPQLAPLPRRPRSPPNSRSADNERPVTPPASDQLPSSFNLDPKRLPRWVKLSLSGVVLLLGGLELTLQSCVRPPLSRKLRC